jgi:tyrosinase
MAVDTIRRNAQTMPAAEFTNFLRACVLLKNRQVPGQTFSVYDQFVAIHGCIMGVRTPGSTRFENLGHQNIGFLPWHREYLRRFELALQAEVPGVAIPYWPWPLTPEPSDLFSNNRIHRIFFSSSAQQAVDGLFAQNGPTTPPSWWPAGFRWRVQPALQVGGSPILRRGSPDNTWPPAQSSITTLENLNQTPSGINVYWMFWRNVEAGARMHNQGHNIVGGYMMNPVFSPNDPLFWLHHAFIDRTWTRWQANRRTASPGSTFRSHYPGQNDISPFNGQAAPNGHRIDDIMWPWTSTTPGYAVNAPAGVQAMLINFSNSPARRVRDVLDIENMGTGLGGYAYDVAPPRSRVRRRVGPKR